MPDIKTTYIKTINLLSHVALAVLPLAAANLTLIHTGRQGFLSLTPTLFIFAAASTLVFLIILEWVSKKKWTSLIALLLCAVCVAIILNTLGSRWWKLDVRSAESKLISLTSRGQAVDHINDEKGKAIYQKFAAPCDNLNPTLTSAVPSHGVYRFTLECDGEKLRVIMHKHGERPYEEVRLDVTQAVNLTNRP